MADERRSPQLLVFLFGAAAEAARQGASPRLLAWCQAFEDWMQERRERRHDSITRASLLSWERLLGLCRKAPWEIGREEIEDYVSWLQRQDYAPSSIKQRVSMISSFYIWCDEHGTDPECEAGFNPTVGVKRPKMRTYTNAKALSQAEARALLGVMRQDASLLGQRDYAFFLARLRLGGRLEKLRKLKWGQIGVEAGEARVRWRAEGAWQRLPEEVWEAVRDYLQAAGRLKGMRAGEYVFAPLRDALRQPPSGLADDWNVEKPLSSGQVRASLKLYGRMAGIEDEKLQIPALRHTATLLRLEEGDSLEEIQAFLDSQALPKVTQNYLRRLAAVDRGEAPSLEKPRSGPRRRKATAPKPGADGAQEAISNQAAQEAVARVMAEGVTGMEAELAGLRQFGGGLSARMLAAKEREEAAMLGGAYIQLVSRVRGIEEIQRAIEERQKDYADVEKRLAQLEEADEEDSEPPRSREDYIAWLRSGADGEIEVRGMPEEIATMRLLLRKFLDLEREAMAGREYARLANLYGNGCIQLARLLKFEPDDMELVGEHLRWSWETALREVHEEIAIYKETGVWPGEKLPEWLSYKSRPEEG